MCESTEVVHTGCADAGEIAALLCSYHRVRGPKWSGVVSWAIDARMDGRSAIDRARRGEAREEVARVEDELARKGGGAYTLLRHSHEELSPSVKR